MESTYSMQSQIEHELIKDGPQLVANLYINVMCNIIQHRVQYLCMQHCCLLYKYYKVVLKEEYV